MKERGPTRPPSDIIQRLKRWCFRTVRPNVRWKSLLLAGFLWLVMVFGNAKCEESSTSSLVEHSAVPQALNDNPDLVRYWDPLEKYLTRYGYLSSSPAQEISSGNLRTEERLADSIKIMQKFGNIPQTGLIDRKTIALLNRKRCGMPDLLSSSSDRVRRFALQGQKWEYTNLTWSIRDWPPNIDPRMVRQELTKAFKVWSDVSKLDFVEIRNTNADIVVSFLRGDHNDGYPFDGRGIVLAHAFFPGKDIGGDAHFDAEEPWVKGEPLPGLEGVSLFAVAAHEFGHSLGLSHSSVPGSLMNPFYQTVKDNFQLPQDDTFGIRSLYGARNPTRWEPRVTYNPGTGGYQPRTRPTTVTRRPSIRSTGRPYTTTRKNHHSVTKTPAINPNKPNTCTTSIDAISIIRQEIFLFKDKYFWRLYENGTMKNALVAIQSFWLHAPDLEKVDAVYERMDTKIVFFSGKHYYLFNANYKERGYPRPLTDLGLPPSLQKIDAAMVWGHNGKTYLFSGSKYWRYEESEGRVELDYPRDMAMWRGVPYHIDAAFRNKDGNTYFFKGRRFWKFNDRLMNVHDEKPGNINEKWLGCPSRTEHLPSTADEATDHLSDDGYSDSITMTPKAVMNFIFVFVILFQKYSFS